MSIQLRANAINTFITGCKADGTWDAIKACCILAGWDSLNGALVPLKGAAPTNFNFVSGDYNRQTGLLGDGSTKYLNSNRNNNADPQDNKHVGVYIGAAASSLGYFISSQATSAGNSRISWNGANIVSAINTSAQAVIPSGSLTGFLGASRPLNANFDTRVTGATTNTAAASQSRASADILVYVLATSQYTNARLSFYSIGEALDLALLDTRVTQLITDLNI
jgi:hypothetical protein